MRARIVLVAGGLLAALFIGAPALAEQPPEQTTFPDLPGMRLADRATRGEVAPSHASFRRDAPAPSGDQLRKQSTPDAKSIAALPGTGQIPIIGQMKVGLSSSRGEAADTMPRGLAALAALGTIVSVGSFLVFRDRIVGR